MRLARWGSEGIGYGEGRLAWVWEEAWGWVWEIGSV